MRSDRPSSTVAFRLASSDFALNTRLRSLWIGLVLGLLWVPLALRAEPRSPEPRQQLGIVGQQAPALGVSEWSNLPEGQSEVSLADLQGKVIYLYFFQSWCPGCHSHGFPTLQEVHATFGEHPNVAFVTVQTTFEGYGTNTADRAFDTLADYGLAIPVGHDSNEDGGGASVMKRYRSGGTPWTVLIDTHGKVRFNGFQLDPSDAKQMIELLLATGG